MNTKPYQRVVLLGVDGAGRFFRQANTPNLDQIFASGATNYDVLTSEPTISAECWGSMLLGVSPKVHKLTNSIVDERRYDINSKYPSAFRIIRENDPDAVLASFCNWNPINHGIVECNLDVYQDTADDDELTDKICAYLEENTPTFLFVQFDDVDGAGHGHGYGTAEHLRQIETTDGYIRRIFDVYEKRGLLDTTLFMVTADHGGFGHSHGGSSDDEKYVMFAARGKTVVPGTIGDMEIRDCPAIILHALGYARPATWTGRIPANLFEGVAGEERPVDGHGSAQTSGIADADKCNTEALCACVGRERILSYMPMDDYIADAVGKKGTASHGKLYFVDGGYVGGGMKFEDGYISASDYQMSETGFSVCFWMKNNGTLSGGASFFGFANTDAGCTLTYEGDTFCFALGEEKVSFAVDAAEGEWKHYMLVLDAMAREVRLVCDFESIQTKKLPDTYTFAGFTSMNVAQNAAGDNAVHLSCVLDEFLVLDGALTSDDMEHIAAYYRNGVSK